MIKKFDDPLAAMNAVSDLKQRTKIVELDDNFKVTVRTLGAKDETDTFIECMNLWGQAFLYKHKLETLCRSIIDINGVSIQAVDIVLKRDIMGKWSQEVIDELYIEYARLIGNIDAFLEKMKLTAETNVVGAKEYQDKMQKDAKEKTDE
ncbi:MAG: hypothetical protein Q7R33_01980 [Nitrosarchaeum sp.]|nr:hypothetical protein [Nitrosarchaeum sp.]